MDRLRIGPKYRPFAGLVDEFHHHEETLFKEFSEPHLGIDGIESERERESVSCVHEIERWLFSTHVCAHLKAIYPLVRGQAISVLFHLAPRQGVCRTLPHNTIRPQHKHARSMEAPVERARNPHRNGWSGGGGSAVVCARSHPSVGRDHCWDALVLLGATIVLIVPSNRIG
ncbi:uncharacterized protein LOC126567108 [Anopheles maculipalpis]|uniref:uncharacterized protein LOC126567108 n=1 Tax=Anopheles maculipalpis TaxID=1496333 RepID=UPI0021598708|nr:uncharacterized protein LOC126567108 [Anopheles maculipalpis]